MDNGGLDLSDIEGLNLQQVEKIQEKAKARAKKNLKVVVKAMRTYDCLFRFMYGSLASLSNATSYGV